MARACTNSNTVGRVSQTMLARIDAKADAKAKVCKDLNGPGPSTINCRNCGNRINCGVKVREITGGW